MTVVGGTTPAQSPPRENSPSRAQILRAERESKRSRLSPPQRSTLEQGLRKFEIFSHFLTDVTEGVRGFHFDTGNFPGGAGFSGGIGFTGVALGSRYADRDLPNRFDIDTFLAASRREYFKFGLEATLNNLWGAPLGASFHASAYEYPQEDFFGLGPESRREDRTNYLLRSLETGADLWITPLRNLRVGGGIRYLSPSIGSGRDRRFASSEEVFDESSLPGFTDQPDFWRYDGFLDFDHRDQPRYPRSGGFYGLRFSSFRDRHLNTFHFRRYELDTQFYLPLPDRYRVLALRGNLVVTDRDGGGQVPFYFMPTLGGPHALRGYREFRFRGRHSILVTAEYRWEAWWPLDLALFVEAGKVASRLRDVDLGSLELGSGIAFRFHTRRSLSFRLDLAFSHEGFIPLLRFEHVF